MDGCPDCKQTIKSLEKNNVLCNYNMLTLYTKDSYGAKEWVDNDDLFLEIYGIDWYPSFLIISEDNYKFIGQETEDKLIEILKKGI